jgi:hypothetical protein
VRLPVPAGATEAYEALRQRVVQADGPAEQAEGRGILIRCGLARWAQVQAVSMTAPPPAPRPSAHHGPPEMPAALQPEFVRIFAGLILNIRQEVLLA